MQYLEEPADDRLFLFLEGAAYILLLIPKENRKSAAVRFGISSVLSVLLSAFSALPGKSFLKIEAKPSSFLAASASLQLQDASLRLLSGK